MTVLLVPAELVNSAVLRVTEVDQRLATVEQIEPGVFKVASACSVDAGERGFSPPTALPDLSAGSEASTVLGDTSEAASLDAPAGIDATCDCGRHAPSGTCSECESNEAMKGDG